MARARAMAQSSRARCRERSATPDEELPPGIDDSVPSPRPRRNRRRVTAGNASARDAVAGPGVDGVAPPPPLRRSKRVQAAANASARDAHPSADRDPPEVTEFPCSLLVASNGNGVISFNGGFINFANDLINFINELITKIAYSLIPIVPSPGPSSGGSWDQSQC